MLVRGLEVERALAADPSLILLPEVDSEFMTSTIISSGEGGEDRVGVAVNNHPRWLPHMPHDAMRHPYPGNQESSVLASASCTITMEDDFKLLNVNVLWTYLENE